ncbi:MAG: oxidoreductase, partial [Akkermansiaceae bacterium]|nr:oxidoreductase [Akkermansiaceae bacterium]
MQKNILLIGGNSGIGLATAQLLHASGHLIVAAARQAGPLAEMGIPVQPFDAASPALNDLPPVLDGLVYFPGSITLKPFHRVTAEDSINDFQPNCPGAAAAIQAAL